MRVPNTSAPLVSIPGGESNTVGNRRYGLSLNIPMEAANSTAASHGGNSWLKPIADGFADVAKATEMITRDILQKRAETDASNAYASLAQESNDFLYGQDGVFSRQGVNAANTVADTRTFYDKAVHRHSKGLNDAAARLFTGMADRSRLTAQTAVARHEGEQLQVAQFVAVKSCMAADHSAALLGYNNDRLYNDNLEQVRLGAERLARLNGWDDATTAQFVQKATTETQLGRMQRFTESGDFERAFDIWKNTDMTADARFRSGEELGKAYFGALIKEAKTNPSGMMKMLKGSDWGAGEQRSKERRGIRNHNPGNIVKTANAWDGEVEGTDEKFKSFATPEHGIAAVGKNLLAYAKKGINTIEGVIYRWAPPKENNTAAYVSRVAKDLGVEPKATIDLRDPTVLSAFTRAIISHENGGNPYSDEQIQAGVDAALGKSVLPTAEKTAGGGSEGGNPGFVKNLNPQSIDDLVAPSSRKMLLDLVRTEQQQQQKAAFDASMDQLYGSFRSQLTDLNKEQAFELFVGQLERIENPTIRKELLDRYKKDEAVFDAMQTRTDRLRSGQFKDLAKSENILPSQAGALIDKIPDLSDAGKEKLKKHYSSEQQKEDPRNRELTGQLFALIDTGSLATATDIQDYAYKHSLTDRQLKLAETYLNEGGNAGRLSYSKAKTIYAQLTKGGNLDKQPEFFEAVKKTLLPGKAPDEAHVRKVIANLLMDGETGGSGWYIGAGRDETYFDAVKNGRGDAWMPEVTKEEGKEISRILKSQNITSTPERIRMYKKHQLGMTVRGTK